jgi:predicted peptidase
MTSQTASTVSPTPSAPQLLRKSFKSKLTDTVREYWLYLPRGYGDDDRRWPVILFLHGGGERGEDLDKVLKHGPLKETSNGRDLPFLILGPQMPSRATTTRPPRRLEPWPAGKRKPMLRETLDAEEPNGPLGPPNGWHESEQDLLAILDATLSDYRTDPDRVYLTGLSYGGFGCWYMASHYPDRWAAVAPICGAGELDEVHKIGHTPVWLFQGGRDDLVLPEWSLATADTLDEAGGDVRVTVHEDLAHDCWTRVYGGRDLYDWFLSNAR